MTHTSSIADLTTTEAPFIEEARGRGELYIEQPYELYSVCNHATWRRLYSELEPKWQQFANRKFLGGLDRIALDPDAIPRLQEINRFLEPLSRFKAVAVSGYVPAYAFFDCLCRREFPTTITIRPPTTSDYLPEPDIFHDLAGHVPMHTGREFSNALVRFGEVAHAAALRAQASLRKGDEGATLALESNIRALARFFWFTIEFCLVREGSELKALGSGLLSSKGEIEHAILSPDVQRHPLRLEWVVNQAFEIDHYQPLLFIVDSFDHLSSEVDRLERWLADGRLDNVAAGEPAICEDDLAYFLEAEA